MSYANSSIEILEELKEKIELATKLLSDCTNISNVCGKQRLLKKTTAELSFLKKLLDSENLKVDHVRSSNLTHLAAIYQCITLVSGVTRLLEPFIYHHDIANQQEQKRLVVDVVCDQGKTWIKVIARNPLALILTSAGAGKYGQKTIIEHVKDILECAKQNEFMFEVPAVKIWFLCSYTEELVEILKDFPVEVVFMQGNPYSETACPSHFPLNSSLDSCASQENNDCHSVKDALEYRSHVDCELTLSTIPEKSVINLDVSSMIAYTSNLTNGYANVKIQDRILSEQAQREQVFSVGQMLKELFKNHELICCNTAYLDFKAIVSCVGGPKEKERAEKLFEKITVVADQPSERTTQLLASSKIKPRSKVVFGTGDTHQAVTVTANYGFLRAAKGQGLRFVAIFHESRALSEMKEVKN